MGIPGVELEQVSLMDVGATTHEQEPVGLQTIPQVILFLMQKQGGKDLSALPWEGETDAAVRPESAPDAAPGSEEIVANLLRAIEGTEIAARLGRVPPLRIGLPAVPVAAPPADSTDSAATLLPIRETDRAVRPEPAPDTLPESDQSVITLLRAIQTTEVAAGTDHVPHPDDAIPTAVASVSEVEIEVSTPALPQAPEPDAPAHPEFAQDNNGESGECLIVLQQDGPASETVASLDTAPPPADNEPSAIAPTAPAETAEAAATLHLPAASPSGVSPARQIRRAQKRGAHRRQPSRERAAYLLSIAAPAVVPLPAAVEGIPAPAAEPCGPGQPAEPLQANLASQAPDSPLAVEHHQPLADSPSRPAELVPPLPLVAAIPELPQSSAQGPVALPTPLGPHAAAANSSLRAPSFTQLGTEKGSLAATAGLINEGLDRAEIHLERWFQKWFGPPDPRHSRRVAEPPLVAFHWIVDTPQALRIANISAGGLHLLTNERWSPGNIVSMTLQRTDMPKGSRESWIAVDFLVMRWCKDGMAGAFIASVPGLKNAVSGRAQNCADKRTLERFVEKLASPSHGDAQAMPAPASPSHSPA